MKKERRSRTLKENKATLTADPAQDITTDLATKKPKPFPIVGFGASAGGLEAFTRLLTHLDENLGMAYVLIMHLSPNHKSALKEILQAKTKMPVHTVKNGMEVIANNLYVIPPNTFMSLVDGHLKLAPRGNDNFSVDYFLTTLAAIYKNNAIGVILSGTATDGTLGLKAIKAEGGITFAQNKTAKFYGMPGNAIDSGYVDFILPPEEIAKELSRLIVPYTLLPSDTIETAQKNEINAHTGELRKILSIVKNRVGVDFFHNYKHASIYRRVVRRMVLNKFERLEDYYSMLKHDPAEVDSLYDDFLINVTNFFRDPDFYDVLHRDVFPALVKQETDSIRIWVAGCATGEEAYSIAISLMEFLENIDRIIPIKIFASDLDANAIDQARLGIYPLSALNGISPVLLKKYFLKTESRYQIVKAVREVCVFSRHNLLKDPPFSRVDLISCQNVLIYLETLPQKKILQTFHYALKPSGFLFLGKSETVGSAQDLFESLDKKIKYFSRKPTRTPQLDFIMQPSGIASKENLVTDQYNETDIEKVMSKVMLSRFVHPGVVVNRDFMIIQFFGTTSAYLEPVTGKASLNILKMVREDIVIDLGGLLHHARKHEKTVSKDGVMIRNKKNMQEITIEVVPHKISGEFFFLVVFKEVANKICADDTNRKLNGRMGGKEKKIQKLEEELVQSRSLIRTTNEEYVTTYEELQANNEEILSSNEELQSVNEELETSKEELQSSNEELTVANEELRKRNAELDESHKQLKQLNEQLEQFAFVSSHDLQEPIRKIAAFSDILIVEPRAELNDYAKNYLSKIHASARRMSVLLKDFLSLAILINHNKRKLAVVDLNLILKDILGDFELIIQEKKATINVAGLPSIHAQSIQMNQLFHNLLSNALRFSKENPVITISSREATPEDFVTYVELNPDVHYVSITVADNGIGFNQKYASKIFGLFQRLNDVKNTEGTGVGLAICKRIVDDHSGFIFAKGEENVGASFTLFFPI